MMLKIAKKAVAAAFITSVFIGGSITLADIGPFTVNPLRIFTFALALPAIMWLSLSILGRYPKFTLYFLTLGGTSLYAILSLSWVTNLSAAIQVVSYILTADVIVFTILSQHDWIIRNRVFLYKILMINLIFICAVGFLEIVRDTHFFASRDLNSVAANERMAGILGWNVPIVFEGNPNNLALMAVLFLFTIYGLRESVFRYLSRTYRALAYVTMFGLVGLVVLTASRAAVGGLLLGIGLLASEALFRLKGGGALRLFPIMAMIGGLGFALLISGNIFNYLIAKNATEGSGGFGVRSGYYSNAIQSALESYGMGSGAASYTRWNGGRSYHYHLLEVLADFGVIAFAMHVIILLTPAIVFIAHARISPRNVAFGVSLAVLPILMFGPSSLYAQPSFWMWFAIVALFSRYAAVRDRP